MSSAQTPLLGTPEEGYHRGCDEGECIFGGTGRNRRHSIKMLRSVVIFGTRYPLRGLATMLAGTMMLVAVSIMMSFPNLNTYMISYMRARTNPEYSYSDFIWISQGRSIVCGLTGMVGGLIASKFGLKATLIFGSSLYSAGYALTYFSLDAGVWACMLTISFCDALGQSVCYYTSVAAVMKWFPGRAGLMGSVCIAGFGFGSVIWNPLETQFVNPDNIPPEDIPGDNSEDKYFTDSQVLDRIPLMFLLLGGVSLAMEIVAMSILREPTEAEIMEIKSWNVLQDKSSTDTKLAHSVSTREAITGGLFWAKWGTLLCVGLLMSFLGSYQKTYGQIYISDDTFLAVAATVQSVVNGVGRITWGFIFDYLGYKKTMLCITSGTAFFTLTFVCLPFLESNVTGAKAFYLIWTSLIYGIGYGNYACYPPQILKEYGPDNTSTIYGFMFTSSIASSIGLIIYTQTLFDFIGYNWTFIIVGGMSVLSAVITFLYNDQWTSEDLKLQSENKRRGTATALEA